MSWSPILLSGSGPVLDLFPGLKKQFKRKEVGLMTYQQPYTLNTTLLSSQNFEYWTSKAQICYFPFNNSTDSNQYCSCSACIYFRTGITFLYVLCLFNWPSVCLLGSVKGGIHISQRENPLKDQSILLPTEMKMVQLRVHHSPAQF
jgi:hypothetical protein